MPLSSQREVELMSKSQAGQGDAKPLRFVQSDPHVLDEVLDEKTGIKVIIDNTRPQLGKRPTPSRTRTYRLHDRLEI